MIDSVYHLRMGLPILKEQNVQQECELSVEAVAIIDHIGQILAEEYVKLLKENPYRNQEEEE